MSTPPNHTNTGENELRVIVDAQIVLGVPRASRSPRNNFTKAATAETPDCANLSLLWTPDIINDYERGAEAIEADGRIMGAEFDRVGFQLFLAALQLWPPVGVSIATMRNARRRILQAPRSAERDIEDAVYLACAVDGHAHLLTTEDSDLRLLGDSYEDVRIHDWRELEDELLRRGLFID